MQKFLIVATVALLATSLAFPVVEDSWDAEDELLQRVYEDSTPLTLMQADPKTIAHAEAAKKSNAAIAKKAAGEEAAATAEEAKTTKAAKELNKKQRKLTRAAAKSNADAAKNLADYSAEAADKTIAAEKATAAAVKANAKAQKKYKKRVAALKKAGKAADAASDARLKKYKSEMADNAKKIKAGNAAEAKAQSDLKANDATLKKKMKAADDTFDKTTAANKAAFDKKEKELAGEETAAQDKFAKEFKGNHAKEVAKKAELKAEKESNDKAEAADKARIERVYDAKQKAQDKVEAAEKKEEDEETEAEKNRHQAANKKIADKLAADKAVNDKDDAKAASMELKAKQADNEYKATLVKDKEISEKQKEAEDAEDHTDEEMKGCKEYVQCEVDSEDGSTSKCFDVINVPAGYKAAKGATHYMAKDLIGCTTDKSEAADMGEDAHAGESWTGLPAPLPPPPAPTPSKACKKGMKELEEMYDGVFAEALGSKTTCPCEAIACNKDISRKKAKKALEKYYDVMSICPEWCQPGSKQTDKYGNGAAEICMTHANIQQMKEQIEDMPQYHDMGTNGRFKAGEDADVCRMTKNFIAGWKAAAGEEELIQAGPKTIAHAEAAKKANAKAAKSAARIEAKWTKKEATFTKKAKALKAKDEALKNAAAKANAKAAKDLADDAADAASKVQKANAATAKAEKKNAKMQKKYKKIQAKMAKQGKKAAAKSAKRLKKYKKEMAANAKGIAAGKAAAVKAADDQKKNAASNKAALAKAAATFHAKKKALAKEFAANKKALDDEKDKMEKKFDAEDAKNKSDAAKEMLKLKKEKTMNAIKAKAAQAKIDADAAKISAAHAKKDKLWHEKEALAAKALAESRASKKEKTEKKAKAVEAKYQKAKGVADKMQADADAADKKEKDYAKKMAADQAAQDKAEDEEDKTDEEMKGCKSDGTECELDNADGSKMTCHAVKNPPAGMKAAAGATYYMAKDLVTCTKDKSKASVDKGYAGSNWTGLTDAPTPAPAGPSAECKKLRKAFFAKGAVGATHKTAESIACAKDLSAKASKSALEAFFHMGSECPEVCDDEEDVHDTSVDGKTTTQRTCVTPEDIGMMREQIEDMPNYKDMGTNGRFKAGPPADVCRMVKNIEAGWNAGKQ